MGFWGAKLQLPSDWRIHDVFHVSLLRPWIGYPTDVPSVVYPVVDDGLPAYQVECIISHRDRPVNRRKAREYLVKWAGLPDESNSWLPFASLPAPIVEAYLVGTGQEGEDG